MKKTLALISSLALLAGVALAADEDGFKPLFNGKDTAGWKLRNPNGNNCWTVDEGIIKNTIPKGGHGVDLLTERMKDALLDGNRIELRGFGVFEPRPRKSGSGRNIKTGASVLIPKGKSIRFKPGKDLREIEVG